MDTKHPTTQFIILVFVYFMFALTVVISLVLQDIGLNGCTEKINTLCNYYNASK